MILVVVVVVVLAGSWIASRVSVNYYVLTPGDATPVSQYIEVPPADNHPLTGKILLTDVYLTQLNALNYLKYKYLDSNSEVVSGPDLFGPTPDESQFLAQGYLQMAQAQSYATAAALTRLGYTVHSTNAGALVYGIQPGSPAAKSLKVAQVITAVNGTSTPTDCALIDSLHGLQPKTSVSLSVEQSSINDVGTFVAGPIVHESVTLGTPPKGLVDTGCGVPTKPTAYLGVDSETQLRRKSGDRGLEGLAVPGQGDRAHAEHRRPLGRPGHDARHHRQTEQRAPDRRPDRGRHRDDRPARQRR